MSILRSLKSTVREVITVDNYSTISMDEIARYEIDLNRRIDTAVLETAIGKAMKDFPLEEKVLSNAWLAPRVHASLRLWRREAADSGLWEFLTIKELRDYVVWRWADANGRMKNLDLIYGPLRRNALARLWWTAEIARNGAQYGPVVNCFKSQDMVNYLTDVDAFHNRAATQLIRVLTEGGHEPTKKEVVSLGKAFNHLLVVTMLDVVSQNLRETSLPWRGGYRYPRRDAFVGEATTGAR